MGILSALFGGSSKEKVYRSDILGGGVWRRTLNIGQSIHIAKIGLCDRPIIHSFRDVGANPDRRVDIIRCACGFSTTPPAE